LSRRRRRDDVAAGAGYADEAAFITGEFGADAVAAYSADFGVTLVSTKVSDWADMRGGGFGPTLSQSTDGNRPGWNATDDTIDGREGAACYLFSAASALLASNGALTLAYIGSVIVAPDATSRYVTAIGTQSFSRFLGIQNGTSSSQLIKGTGGSDPYVTAASTVATSNTRRLAIVTKTATDGVGIEVPNNAKVSTTGAGVHGAGNNELCLFASASSGAQVPQSAPGVTLHARAIIVLSREATAGDITKLVTWANTYHGMAL
jgi:hypothetical protein